jgi:hypothetical protein
MLYLLFVRMHCNKARTVLGTGREKPNISRVRRSAQLSAFIQLLWYGPVDSN